MVLVFSEIFDSTTNDVLNWLKYFKTLYLRINTLVPTNNFFYNICLQNDKSEVQLIKDGNYICLDKINSVWYRRHEFEISKNLKKDTKNDLLIDTINNSLFTEFRDIRHGIYSFLSNKYILGNFIGNLNKIKQLQVAVKYEINIPISIITTKKQELIEFFKRNKLIINKPISNISFFDIKKTRYTPYTFLIDNEFIEKLNDTFFPSLFQQYIEKEFEIRSFLLDNKFYSMAIFSQSNKRTEIDFRKYDHVKPNRTISFKLPECIEDKLLDLAKAFNLNTGSFDLIYSKTGEYYFLEVNPVGQFGMVSYPCNYYLEKIK